MSLSKLFKKNYLITDNDILKDTDPILRKKAQKVAKPYSEADIILLNNLRNYVVNTQLEYNKWLNAEYAAVADENNDKTEVDFDSSPLTAIGIAAPQVGISKQIFYVYVPFFNEKLKKQDAFEKALINPVIYRESLRKSYLAATEGCLSVKSSHVHGYVQRPYQIHVKAYDLLVNKEVDFSVNGMFAIVIQHEMDHLKGILFIDRINKENPFDCEPDAVAIER